MRKNDKRLQVGGKVWGAGKGVQNQIRWVRKGG